MEKKYLKWYNKIGYGSGDIAGSGVYNFLAAFVMLYLTTTIGLNAGEFSCNIYIIMAKNICNQVDIVGLLINSAAIAAPQLVRRYFLFRCDDRQNAVKTRSCSSVDAIWLHWLCNHPIPDLCNPDKLGKNRAVCLLLYHIYPSQRCILYS